MTRPVAVLDLRNHDNPLDLVNGFEQEFKMNILMPLSLSFSAELDIVDPPTITGEILIEIESGPDT